MYFCIFFLKNANAAPVVICEIPVGPPEELQNLLLGTSSQEVSW